MSPMNQYIEGLLSTGEVIPPPRDVERWFGIPDQDAFVAASLRDPEGFWRERARRIAWENEPRTVFHGTLEAPHWFADGRLNATVSCLDRHAASHPDATAYDYLCENGTEERVTTPNCSRASSGSPMPCAPTASVPATASSSTCR